MSLSILVWQKAIFVLLNDFEWQDCSVAILTWKRHVARIAALVELAIRAGGKMTLVVAVVFVVARCDLAA
jgi:hypothetical protein